MRAKAAQLIAESDRERRQLAAQWRRDAAQRARPAPVHREAFTNRPFARLAEILFKKEE